MTQETFKERKARGLRSQEVNTISADAEFQAMHANRPKNIVTDYVSAEDSTLMGRPGDAGLPRIHTAPHKVTMYKPDGFGHYTPRSVPATTIAQNLTNGWAAHCPDCGGDHDADPNSCPGRDAVAVRVCPVCRKRIYDNMDVNATGLSADEQDDPNVIKDDAYAASTPETRTKVLLDTHIWAKHPQSARIMALTPLAEPSDDMLNMIASRVGAGG